MLSMASQHQYWPMPKGAGLGIKFVAGVAIAIALGSVIADFGTNIDQPRVVYPEPWMAQCPIVRLPIAFFRRLFDDRVPN